MQFNKFIELLEENASQFNIEETPKNETDKFGIKKLKWNSNLYDGHVHSTKIVAIIDGIKKSKPKNVYFISRKDYDDHYHGNENYYSGTYYQHITIDDKTVQAYYHSEKDEKEMRSAAGKSTSSNNWDDLQTWDYYEDKPILRDPSSPFEGIVYNTNRVKNMTDHKIDAGGLTRQEAKNEIEDISSGSGKWVLISDDPSFEMFKTFREALMKSGFKKDKYYQKLLTVSDKEIQNIENSASSMKELVSYLSK